MTPDKDCEDRANEVTVTPPGGGGGPRLARVLRVSWPHLVLLLVYFVYLGLGGWVFLAIEGRGSVARAAEAQLAEYRALKDRLDEAVRNLTEGRDVVLDGPGNLSATWEGYSHLVEEPYLTDLEFSSRAEWTFTGSVLFCATTIATIGYGFMTPKTQLGRGICIIYALIGIPLNIIVMASAGKALTRGIRAAQQCLGRCKRHALAGLALWKTRVGPQADIGSGTSAATLPRVSDLEDGMSDAYPRSVSPIRDVDWDSRDASNSQSAVAGAQPHEADVVPSPTRDDEARTTAASPDDGDLQQDPDPDVSSCAFVFLVLLYTCVFAVAMYLSEPDWTLLDGFYYIIITITTIGFGDQVTTPAMSDDADSAGYYLLSCLSIAIPVIGMILLSAGIGIVVSQCGKKTRAIERLICGSSSEEKG